MLPIGKNMAGKRGASNHAASTAATAAATAATAAAALAAEAAAALAAEAAAALAADAAAALPAQAATTALTAVAETTALPPSPSKKRPARACNSPNKLANIAAVHGVVPTKAGTTEKSAEAPSGTSYYMRQRLLPTQGSSSQNDEDNSGDEDALEKDDDSEKDDDMDKEHESAVELTPKKVLPVIANLKRGRGRPPKPSSPQGTSNPYP